VWNNLKGQIYIGGEAFLQRMQHLVEGKAVRGIARVQIKPLRPEPEEILAMVGRAFRLSASLVWNRSHPEAYEAAVYLLCRAGNLSLSEVAERAGVSLGRISQIQAKIERGQAGGTLAGLLRRYKLKP